MTFAPSRRRPRPPVPVPRDHSVTQFELFFDLVFVFALTQVTNYMSDHLSARGMLEGLLVLGVMWWSWVGYSWLGTVVRADEGLERLVILGAMAALLVQGIALPEAFHDEHGGLPGPLVVAACYVVVRVLHISLFLRVARAGDDGGLHDQLLLFCLPTGGGVFFVGLGAALAQSGAGRAAIACYAVALLIDLGGTMAIGASGWRVGSPSHFAERHALIVIIALGESLISIGAGAQHTAITLRIVVAAVLGLAIVTALWWAYFDSVSTHAEHRFESLEGTAQAALARDSYSLLHLPMVAGIVLVALGLKKGLLYTAEHQHSLHTLPAVSLTFGLALYLLAHAGFKLRTEGHLQIERSLAAIGLMALTPVVAGAPVLLGLTLVSAILVALMAYESIARRELREAVLQEHH